MSDPARGLPAVLDALLGELADGASPDAAWILNPGDPGLLRSLERLGAAEASSPPPGGGPSVAAHVDHLRYGLRLLLRWSRGEDPFGDADYAASWRRGTVTEEGWRELRAGLAAELAAWREAVRAPRELTEFELTGVVASVAHLAYHLGALRQADRRLAGPSASD